MARIKYYDNAAQEWAYADMAVALPSSRLPSAYQEVEYIESTGTQYIDTGVPSNEIYEINGDIEYTTIAGQYFGTYDFDGSKNTAFACGIRANGNSALNLVNQSNLTELSSATTNRFRFTVSVLLGKYLYEKDMATFTAAYPTSTANFYLFARFNANTTPPAIDSSFMCSMKVYRMAFKDRDNLISHDFVPCYRIADNEIGMYDLVSKTFFTNDGTGTFIKGADV